MYREIFFCNKQTDLVNSRMEILKREVPRVKGNSIISCVFVLSLHSNRVSTRVSERERESDRDRVENERDIENVSSTISINHQSQIYFSTRHYLNKFKTILEVPKNNNRTTIPQKQLKQQIIILSCKNQHNQRL